MPESQVPAPVQRVLHRFRSLSREEKMQALLHYARSLQPLPERFAVLDREAFNVPECQTRVDIFPELRDGLLWFHADINARQSPTIAAFLAVTFSAVNGQPPSTTLAIPPDFAREVMAQMGLGTREVGLDAIVRRLKTYALEADQSAQGVTPATFDPIGRGAEDAGDQQVG